MHALRSRCLPWRWLAGGLVAVASSACGPEPSNPFFEGGGGQGVGGEGHGGQTTVDPELGEPCVEDAQCDDAIDCTTDRCDHDFDRCRHHPEPAPCDNGVYCDGPEVCDGKLGCVPGPPVDCGDDDLCTIDTCVEDSRGCRHDPRDADGDGDPDAHCTGGGDCDDMNPGVSSQHEEICGDGIDDDCDGVVDEADCATPENDTCVDALEIDGSGTYALSTFGAQPDYTTSCSPEGSLRDVVAAVIVPAGPPLDVVARAKTDSVPVSVAIAAQCGDAASEIACGASFAKLGGGMVSRFRARSIGGGGDDTPFPLYVTTAGAGAVSLDVSFEAATTAPTHETCGTAIDLGLDTPTSVEIVDAAKDVDSACGSILGDLVYRITLPDDADLDVWGLSEDGDGQPILSLRDADCALPEDEIACTAAASAHLFRHALPAGDYYLSISATAPTTVNVVANASAPTAPPPDEDCASGAILEPNVTQPIDFTDHQDDHQLGCFQPALDAAYGLTIDEPSDVLLVQRISSGDSASVGLSGPLCDATDVLGCGLGAKSPIRVRERNLAPGDYRVVAESLFGLPQEVTAFVRPHTPTTFVVFADDCASPAVIPETGGFFQGNTSNVGADFSAGCDAAGGPPFGAPDQILELVLTSSRRVILDMTGSSYETILDVRKGTTCPGTEVPVGCTASFNPSSPSYLDLDLDAGTYFVQIDGLMGAVGAWNLDVYVVQP